MTCMMPEAESPSGEPVLHAQAAVVAMSARFNVMDSMEKRVRSRFSHRRDIILELLAEDFDSPDSGPVALLHSFLSLPVSCLRSRTAARELHGSLPAAEHSQLARELPAPMRCCL